MTKANVRLILLAGTTAATTLAGTVAPSAAQTSTTHAATTHHTATAHRPVAKSDCVTVPTLSPKIPALPTGAACPKSMITVTEKIELSPLIGPTIRQGFSNLDSNFTLAYIDQTIGTGAPAQPHMYYTVKYTGYLTDGTKFDSSLDHGDKQTLSFPYGAHRVIPGWDIGFEGMRLGGKRRLFVPWQLAYGERGRPPAIPGKAELVFDMELISQSPTDPDAPPPPPTPPAGPGTPSASPIQGNPPTVTPDPSAPSARPQTGPDVKPAPPTPGTPSTPSNTPPPTAKQPPPQGAL